MDIATAVRTCFSKYATFSGRARRAEFWWFALFNFLANIVLNIVDAVVFGFGHGMMSGGAQPLSGLYSLAVLLPSLAVGARRLHDTGKSGWWQLLVFIPLIGIIVLIWWYATEGDRGPNDHGPDPMAHDAAARSSVPRVPRH